MPEFPKLSQRTLSMSAPGFGTLGPKIAAKVHAGEAHPLHLGDTFLLPPECAREIDLDQPDIHRYISVSGLPELRSATASRLKNNLGLPATPDNVFMTPGSTGALSLVVEALFDPGDEVILLTPSWPLIFGILERRGVVIRELDVGPNGTPHDIDDFSQRLNNTITNKTAGIYYCDPNNPAGFIYPADFVRVITDVALKHKLWILSDIAYAELTFGDTLTLPATLPELKNQVVTVGTFSKIFALAGHRIGFAQVPESLEPLMARLLTHTTYHASTSAQSMALACLNANAGEEIQQSYQAGAELTHTHFMGRFARAQAGAFVFVDLRPLGVNNHEQCLDFLGRCLDVGVALCPGRVFGENFSAFARLCYTTTTLEELKQAFNILNPIFDQDHSIR